MKNFRTYQTAVIFYRQVNDLKLPAHLRDQLLRASSSVALNLAEGRGKRTTRDQCKFFQIAYGSGRECKAIFELAEMEKTQPAVTLDHLCAAIYLLIRNAR